tara:strand:+ start:900 stop:1373 length:474 start_codon:yes stop_codon:yes gene_type:complete
MIAKYDFENLKYNLQHIRDLYDKMFPSAKDYIEFLRKRINTLDYEEYNLNSLEELKGIKKNYSSNIFNLKKRPEKNNDRFFEEDHWKDLNQKDITFYKDLTEKWLKTKPRRQRRIWNYFVLGVPKNSIAPRLKEDSNFVIGTIITLQKEFLNLILKS